jgi:hypothetical protein
MIGDHRGTRTGDQEVVGGRRQRERHALGCHPDGCHNTEPAGTLLIGCLPRAGHG